MATSTAPAAARRFTHHRVAVGYPLGIGRGPERGGDALGVEKILGAVGNAVKRSANPAPGDLAIGVLCLCQGEIASQSDHAFELGAEASEPVEIELGEANAW